MYHLYQKNNYFLISNFRRVLKFVCFLLGNFPVFEFYIPTFRNILFHLHRRMKNDWVPSQAKQSQSSNWGRGISRSASRRLPVS